jgi:hypothetical protein
MSYWKMVRSRAFKDTRAFWNMHQVWKYAGPLVSAIILRLLVRGWSPAMHWQGWVTEATIFIIFGFIVTWGGNYLLNLIHIPPIVHAQQVKEISGLAAKVADLRKPKRTPFQEKEYQAIKSAVDSYDEDDPKKLLRHLMRHGKMTRHSQGKLVPLPAGFSDNRAASALDILKNDHLVTLGDTRYDPSGWEASWQIAPGAIDILNELL